MTATPMSESPIRAEADVVELLLGQHQQIRDLFAEVRTAQSGQPRREAFERLVRMLAVHETAEEMVVHPAARSAVEGGGDVVDDRIAEEREAKEMLKALESMDVEDPGFPRRLDELRRAVLDHAAHEEAYEFRYLRRAYDDERLRTMAGAVRAAERFAPTHPHPGVESAKANVAGGPALALFDRVKDAVRQAMSDGGEKSGKD